MKHTIVAMLALILASCGSPDIEAYRDAKPTLNIREYLNGDLVAYGTITDYSGEVIDHFVANLKGSWNDNQGRLDEDFTFADGHKEQRTWKFTVDDAGNITGTAGDVIGTATGRQLGNAVIMEYTLERERDGDKMQFSMDDRLYLVTDTYLVNVTKMRKYGVTVATLNLGFHKLGK